MTKNATSEKGWPADLTERRSVQSLLPYARNARTHSEAQVVQIAASITEWRWTNPILVARRSNQAQIHAYLLALNTGWHQQEPRQDGRGSE